MIEFKYRQQLRGSSAEIRDLEASLRQSYINKELAWQKVQQEALELQKKQEKAIEAQLTEALRQQAIREEEEDEKREVLEKIKFRMRLDGQTKERQLELNDANVDFLQQKEMIDAVISEVKAEERNKMIETTVKKQMALEEIQEFIESRKIFVVHEQERVARENEQIRAFIAKKDAWAAEHEKILKERKIMKSQVVQKLAEDIAARQANQRHIEALVHELNEGRQRELDKLAQRQELETEIRRRLDIRQGNDIAKAYRDQVRAKEKLEDDIWKARIIADSEEAAKLHQMSIQKRRMKILEVRKEAEVALAERQRLREVAKMKEQLYWKKERDYARKCASMLEEERMRLWKEHAPNLIGFLPTRLLDEEDMENLARQNTEFLFKNNHDFRQKFANNY